MSKRADLNQLLTNRWKVKTSGPFFKIAEPSSLIRKIVPNDYLEIIAEFGGKEGFLGGTYLRLYRFDELVALNEAYDVPKLYSEIVIFGSNGCGEAFAFQLKSPIVIQIPFIPLIAECATVCAASFTLFIEQLSEMGDSWELNPHTVGMEVHDKHPIAMGGDPVNPENKVLVPVTKHAEICRFWNKVYCDARSR